MVYFSLIILKSPDLYSNLSELSAPNFFFFFSLLINIETLPDIGGVFVIKNIVDAVEFYFNMMFFQTWDLSSNTKHPFQVYTNKSVKHHF